jgi:hypothetical protein
MDTIKAGRLLMLDHGEYSDYNVDGFFVVLKDFKPHDELAQYFEANPNQRESYCFERSEFIAFVVAKGYLLAIEYNELYLGSYGSAEFRISGHE